VTERDPRPAAELLPLVYHELRRLATARLADEPAGHTLDATALVHEVYLKLVGPEDRARWGGRTQFFAAAAEAMRRILIDSARRRRAVKRGGAAHRFELSEGDKVVTPDADAVLSLDDALAALESEDAASAAVARLRLFAGLGVEEAADALGVSRATAYRDWGYARAWLRVALAGEA
jgi:RNA polymerase sigma factor (TIGR02999 family)